MLIAGTFADIDSLSAYFGPSVFLTFDRTYFHSLMAAFLFSLFVTLPFLLRRHGQPERQISPLPLFLAALAASVLHVLMDICQSAGVELLWPFSARRFALDWVAHTDLWILAILLAAILLPALSRLVTEEIGAKSKGPRGKVGSSLALAAMILYVVLRFVLHGNALAAMESRTYRGELPRRVAAFPESDRKSTRLNSSHSQISYAVFCLKKKNRRLHDLPRASLAAYPAPACSRALSQRRPAACQSSYVYSLLHEPSCMTSLHHDYSYDPS